MALMPNTRMAERDPLDIGQVRILLKTGRPVYITDGSFLRNGRVSNCWGYRTIKSDGSLGSRGGGYGHIFGQRVKAKIELKVKITLKPKKTKKTTKKKK